MSGLPEFASKALDAFSKVNSFLYGLLAPKDKFDEKGVQYAFGFRRHCSIFLDMIFMMIVFTILNSVFVFFMPNTHKIFEKLQKHNLEIKMTEEEKQEVNKYIIAALSMEIADLCVGVLLILLFWVKYGTTPGKYICGLCIKDEKTLKNISLKQGVIRLFVSVISCIMLFMGIIWSAFDKKARTWHDRACGSVVVFEKTIKDLV